MARHPWSEEILRAADVVIAMGYGHACLPEIGSTSPCTSRVVAMD